MRKGPAVGGSFFELLKGNEVQALWINQPVLTSSIGHPLMTVPYLVLKPDRLLLFGLIQKVNKKSRKNKASPRKPLVYPAVFSGLSSWYPAYRGML